METIRRWPITAALAAILTSTLMVSLVASQEGSDAPQIAKKRKGDKYRGRVYTKVFDEFAGQGINRVLTVPANSR